MKRFARVFIAALGLMILASAVPQAPQNSAGGPDPGAAPVKTVTVSNFPAALTGAAVPVSGNVTAIVNLPNPLPVQPVKQAVPNFVTLCWGCPDPSTHIAQPFFALVHSDGQTVDTTAFSLQPGKQLVVTDVSWSADCVPFGPPPNNCPPQPGATVTFGLGNAFLSFGSANGGGAARSEHLTGGLALTQLPDPLASLGFPFAGKVILNGYVTP